MSDSLDDKIKKHKEEKRKAEAAGRANEADIHGKIVDTFLDMKNLKNKK